MDPLFTSCTQKGSLPVFGQQQRCNDTGYTATAATKGWGIVDFDWSNGKGTGTVRWPATRASLKAACSPALGAPSPSQCRKKTKKTTTRQTLPSRLRSRLQHRTRPLLNFTFDLAHNIAFAVA